MSTTASFENARFRFAPSPTGLLHIGGVRTALFNWLLARKHKGTFVLRIEDTDKERSTDTSLAAILDGFRWLGIDWDEGPEKGGESGPYFQSERTSFYKDCLDRLLAEGKAYPCFCGKDELEARRREAEKNKTSYAYDRTCLKLSAEEVRERLAAGRPHAVRLKVEPPGVSFTDLIRGPIDFSQQSYDDFVIVRQDGWPVYNFAVTVDDAMMKITHVIRGEEHISNTPRQLYIYRALGFSVPQFGHVPIILATDGSKLSKRHGATSVQQFREQGYLPDALINFLARLGWSYDDTQEIFSREELVEKFTLDKVSPSAGIFNPDKLLWLNTEYMKKLSPEEKSSSCAEALVAAGLLERKDLPAEKERILKVIGLVGERMKLFPQIAELADFIFRAPAAYDPQAFAKFVAGKGLRPFLEAVSAEMKTREPFDAAVLEEILVGLMERLELNKGKAMQAVRIALTGRAVSPDLIASMVLLGRAECLARLERFLGQEGV